MDKWQCVCILYCERQCSIVFGIRCVKMINFQSRSHSQRKFATNHIEIRKMNTEKIYILDHNVLVCRLKRDVNATGLHITQHFFL